MRKMKLIAGPCVIESENHVRMMAEELADITSKYDAVVDWYFKASYDKANRTSKESFRGPGFNEGISILDDLRRDLKIKTTTDFHETHEIRRGAHCVDVVQIPAFLSRQTDMLVVAGRYGNIVNIKKGQFMTGADLFEAMRKVGIDNHRIWTTERGNQFGYGKVVVDVANMAGSIVDCTHPSFAPYHREALAKSAIVSGATGIFMEVHDNPEEALCDGKKSVKLYEFEQFLVDLIDLWKFTNRGLETWH